jgi:hypothetical protein
MELSYQKVRRCLWLSRSDERTFVPVTFHSESPHIHKIYSPRKVECPAMIDVESVEFCPNFQIISPHQILTDRDHCRSDEWVNGHSWNRSRQSWASQLCRCSSSRPQTSRLPRTASVRWAGSLWYRHPAFASIPTTMVFDGFLRPMHRRTQEM